MARKFIVDGTEYPDPGSEVTPEQFKQMMAGFLPELATAEMTEEKQGLTSHACVTPPARGTARDSA